MKYLICEECIGRTIENTEIISACIRWIIEEDCKLPDDCPKRARGVKEEFNPKWKEVSKEEFLKHYSINRAFNTRTRIF